MNMRADSVCVPLPEALDATQAQPLLTALLAVRGKPVEIDASAVRKMSTLVLQVLISARITWVADGVSFRIANPSAEFAEALALAGTTFDVERMSA